MDGSPDLTPPAARRRAVTGSGGLLLAVTEHGPGDAPTIVLVHGYPDTQAVWDLVVPRLADIFHVVTYDVRGAGASGVPADRDGYRVEHLIADVVAVADATSPGRPVHLVGHDWGSIQLWSAVTDPVAAERFASFTSASGPSLDHVGAWTRAHRRPGQGRWRAAGRQGLRSWYIGAFQTPLAAYVLRHGLARRLGAIVERREHAVVDDRWPAPTVEDDAVRGIELYRANLFGRAARPGPVHTDVPVQLVVATDDPYVTPSLLDGIDAIAPNLVRHDVDGGHWQPRSHPTRLARLIAEHVATIDR